MAITYYKCIPISRDKPTTVYRFFDDKKHWPELYEVGTGWIPSRYLLKMRFVGEIRKNDIISEKESNKIIKVLEEEKGDLK